MNPMAGPRAKAYLRDCVVYLAFSAATVPLGLWVDRSGWSMSRGEVLGLSAIAPVAATLFAAQREASDAGATPGKRYYGLQVVDNAGRSITFARALLRNIVKIGVPWQIGHVVAVGAAFGGFEDSDPLTLSATAATYPMIAVMIAGITLGKGKAIHDRIAGTVVRPVGGVS